MSCDFSHDRQGPYRLISRVLVEEVLEGYPEIMAVLPFLSDWDREFIQHACAQSGCPTEMGQFVWYHAAYTDEMKKEYPGGSHCGDCQKQPVSCARCGLEGDFVEAKMHHDEWKAHGGTNPEEFVAIVLYTIHDEMKDRLPEWKSFDESRKEEALEYARKLLGWVAERPVVKGIPWW